MVAVTTKAIESVDFVTMRSLSRLCALALAHTQREDVALAAVAKQAPKKAAKASKKRENGDSSDEEGLPSQNDVHAAASSTTAEGGTTLTLLSSKQMLELIVLKSSMTRKARAALLDVHATLYALLGVSWVQTHYEVIVRHFVDECYLDRAARTAASLILRKVIGERMLGEQAQVSAIQTICTAYLKRWPVLTPGQSSPSKVALAMGLDECAGLLQQLGSAPTQVIEAIHDPLLRLLGHPSYRVQVSAAWCLRTLCFISPLELGPAIKALFGLIEKDLASLNNAGERAGAEVPRRTTGHARGLAAALSVVPLRPLYTSFDVSGQALELSIRLLKESAEHSLAISAVEIEVAWTLIGALMSLGPNFARHHLNQLLNMWRSALPKDGGASSQTPRPENEWGFLLHVRECTLTSIYSFLSHNTSSSDSALTLDTARRIVAMLTNALSFVNSFTSTHSHLAQEQVPGVERNSISLLDREHMVRRRVLQCFNLLAASPALEGMQDSLVVACIQNMAEPDRYVGSAAQAAIAASAGNFSTVWALTDGYAFGLTSLQRDGECLVGASGSDSDIDTETSGLNRDAIEAQLDALGRRPIMRAAEYDASNVYVQRSRLPPPPATGVVDASIELLAALVPFQRRETQIFAIEALLSHTRTQRLDKNPGRRMAIRINACTAVLATLRIAQSGRRTPSGFNNDRLTTALRELLQDALVQGDPWLRFTASEAFGRLAAIAGPHCMSSQVQFLVDQVVNNRDPEARAGCARAFGAVYSSVGGLAAGPLTKTVVDVLLSLSNDPHPTVHYSALEALTMVVEAASLSYSAFVSSTLGMLARLYMLSTHEPEGGSPGSVNLRADLPAHQAICRVLGAITAVLGPDLAESSSAKIRSLIQVLLSELSKEESDDGVVVEATKARQTLALFSQQHVDVVEWISALRNHIRHAKRPLKLAAVNALYQLIQRQALTVSKVGGDGLVEDLFGQLDKEPGMDGVREVLLSWLKQTAALSPGGWMDLCQRIMSRTSSANEIGGGMAAAGTGNDAKAQGFQDEESAAINLGGTSTRASAQPSRWRTQLFALQCLHEVFVSVRLSGRLEHFDTPKMASGPTRTGQQMSARVADLIRMAFTASTAPNVEVRLEGLTVLRDVIDNFKAARDPDFQEALLLEQHQAPIAAALTPAFLSDSTPEVLAAAVQVCAVFVGSGVVKEVDKLGRILRQLTSALDSCLKPSMDGLGDVKGLAKNAVSMLRIAVLAAWSELQVASVGQEYLVAVIGPHVDDLARAWVASLAEYARLRNDAEGVAIVTAAPFVIQGQEDSQYSGLTRQVLLPHFDQAWYKLLHAVAAFMAKDDTSVIAALDGAAPGEEVAKSKGEDTTSSFRIDPRIHFYALYGLAFESMASRGGGSGGPGVVGIALLAMRHLIAAKYAGSALLQDDVFGELLNLAYRLVMTEPALVQIRVVDLIAALCSSYGQRLLDAQAEPTGSSSGIGFPETAKATRCLELILYALENAGKPFLTASAPDDKAALARTCLSAYLDLAATIFSRGQRIELYALAFQAYSQMLRDEKSDADLVGTSLASLKDLCQRAATLAGEMNNEESYSLVRRTLHGFLSSAVDGVDEMRARSGKIATLKTKNSILAVTVVLTSLPESCSGPSRVTISKPVLEQFCYQLLYAATTSPDTIVRSTSLNCLRTIFTRPVGTAPWLRYCVGQLLPGVVAFLASSPSGTKATPGTDEEVKESEAAEDNTREELVKALFGLVSSQAESSTRPRLLGIVLPCLVLMAKEGKGGSSSISQHVLALATLDQVAFRLVASRMDAETRAQLERSLRGAVQARPSASRSSSQQQQSQQQQQQQEAKSIALRSFG